MTQVVLVLNVGSSNVKFFMFSIDEVGRKIERLVQTREVE